MKANSQLVVPRASRTIRRARPACATPLIVPTPNSYSRRISSNNCHSLPFGPSAIVLGSAYPLTPSFDLRSASLASPTAWPTMPSADFCVPIGSPLGFRSPELRDETQTSRGKSDRFHRTPAGSTALALDGSGLRDSSSARPAKDASYPVSVRQVAVLIHASSRPRLATAPLRFTSTSLPSSCTKDFHLLAVRHARHTTEPLGAADACGVGGRSRE